MSMFRRPTDDSDTDSDSDSQSGSDELEEEEPHVTSDGPSGGSIEADLTRTETLSSGESISVDGQDASGLVDVEHHRNMMLASLLEDFYKTRAAELLNTARPGSTYHRQSPEIQSFAKSLFDQASQTLVAGGILPSSVASEDVKNSRNQYLTGFESLGLQNLQESDLLPDALLRRLSATTSGSLALVKQTRRPSGITSDPREAPVRELTARTGSISLMSHSANDMEVTTTQTSRSHYHSSFQEMRLLGKGGFGRVYQTYNLFDKKEYAVKKIPLSPKLSQRYREKGHAELASVLREVQALARLDHCNVVRYHATWIEEPTILAPMLSVPHSSRSHYGQRLLANQPAFPSNSTQKRPALRSTQHSDGIMFEADDVDDVQFADPNWSFRPPESHLVEPSSAADSDIFTDGMARKLSKDVTPDDPFCYVLHVQMSMYPMTLAQYLAPISANTMSSPGSPSRRHCFHLVPALRIILGILCGLQYIHAQGLVHRDIKPGNIFVSSQGLVGHGTIPEGFLDVGDCRSCPRQHSHYINPRIGDFGLVAELVRTATEIYDESGSSSDRVVGTEYYRPPLDKNGQGKHHVRIDEKLDVFALGVILVELLCYCATSMERLGLLKAIQDGHVPEEVIQNIEREGHGSQVSQLVTNCVHGMIHKDSEKRWTCSKVQGCIENLVENCKLPSSEPGLHKVMSLQAEEQ